MKKSVFYFTALLPVFILSGCSSLNSAVGGFLKLDTDVHLTFKVDANINPDESNAPSPLIVRLYELKSDKIFNNANFVDMYERDKDVLGEDLLSKQPVKRIKPGVNREDKFVLNNETRFVGVYAEFLKYKNSTFKVLIPVVPHDLIANSATVHISDNHLRLVKD